MYEADIYIDKVPDFVRSGMSASVDVIVKDSTAMILPKEAVKSGDRGTFVLVTKAEGERPEFRLVKIGTTTSTYIEIISGIATNDNILIVKNSQKNGKKKKSTTVNPFMPQRPGGGRNQQGGGQGGGGGPPHP
jgi:macrolide-specific efflux system membrane fusion protein